MKKKILIAVGGTGGHIFPALSLAKRLLSERSNLHIQFAGGGLHSNQFFNHEDFSYKNIISGHIPFKRPLTCLKNLGKLIIGTFQSCLLIKKFCPNIIIGFGSYHSFPLLMAAKILRIPLILHEANAIPGKVNRLFAKNSLAVGISFPTAAQYLKGKTFLVNMPLREGMNKNKSKKEEALEYYNLSPSKKTILIFGGSQGAYSLNKLIIDLLKCYTGNLKQIQILHLVGSNSEVSFFENTYEQIKLSFCVKAFERNMDKAWSAADLFIGRAGAGTIAEAIEFEIPSILVPFPFAADDHQSKNAEYMVEIVKGAFIFHEKQDIKSLIQIFYELMDENSSKLEELKKALKNYKDTRVKEELSSLVTQFIS